MNINIKSYNSTLNDNIVIENAITIIRKHIFNYLNSLNGIGTYYINNDNVIVVELNNDKKIEISFNVIYGKPTHIDIYFIINTFICKTITILAISDLNNILDSDERIFKNTIESYFNIIIKNK